MVQVADLNRSADKFQRRASQAGQDYQAGVESVSDSEQQDATLAAEATWEQGVQEAISEGRFATGVQNPSQSWQDQALEVGQQRFTQGASNAGPAWQEGFSDFASVLEGLSLEPRGPRGSSANQNRSIQVQEALHNARQS